MAGEHKSTAAVLLSELADERGKRNQAMLLAEAHVHATLHMAECVERLTQTLAQNGAIGH